jgi:hypothetical protein
MKKQLILGSLLALTGIASAQWSTNAPHVYKTNPAGNVGIGTGNSPAFKLDLLTNTATNDGARILNSGNGDACLFLRNGGGGGQWVLHSTGSNSSLGAGHFAISNGSGNQLYIDGSTTYVGIGTTAPSARLQVEDLNSSAGFGTYINYSTGSASGGNGLVIQANNVGAVGTQQNVGVDAYANCGAVGTCIAIASRGSAGGANDNYGGFFRAGAPVGADNAIGVYGIITTGNANAGLSAAVYGNANGFTAAGEWAGYFDGNVNINGQANCTSGTWTSSDRRFKQNVNELTNVSEKIALLNGYTYTYKTEEFKDKNFPVQEQIGFIAQELKEVFPQLVKENADGYLSVNYEGLIPVLLEAIKDQQLQLNEQKELISELQRKSGTPTGLNNNGSVETGVTMSQNEPNPFTNETVINYTLPAQVNSAYMAVYDLSGKQITKFALDQKGAASITITSENLAAGIYIYSIVADGKVMDSKRMIVADK